MPTNLQAPRVDNSTAQIFSALSSTFSAVKDVNEYFAKRELATNDKIARQDLDVKTQEHFLNLKAYLQDQIDSGQYVWKDGEVPLKTAINEYLGDDSAIFQTPDFRALPAANQDAIKQDLRTSLQKSAMVAEHGMRHAQSVNRIQKYQDNESNRIQETSPILDESSGRLMGPNGQPLGRQELNWEIRDSQAFTAGAAMSKIQGNFQEDVHSFILNKSNPSMDVFDSLLEEYKDEDGNLMVNHQSVAQYRSYVQDAIAKDTEVSLEAVNTAIATSKSSFSGVTAETAGDTTQMQSVANTVSLLHHKQDLAAAQGGKGWTQSDANDLEAYEIKLQAMEEVDRFLKDDTRATAILSASGSNVQKIPSEADRLVYLARTAEDKLRDPNLSPRDIKGLVTVRDIARKAMSSDRPSAVTARFFTLAESDKFKADPTLPGLLNITGDVLSSGVELELPADMVDSSAAALAQFHKNPRSADKQSSTVLNYTIAGTLKSAVKAGNYEAGVLALFGTEVENLNLTTEELPDRAQYGTDTSNIALSLLGGHGVDQASKLLDKVWDHTYSALFREDALFADKVNRSQELSIKADPSKGDTAERKRLNEEIRTQLKNSALARVDRTEIRSANGQVVYPKASDMVGVDKAYAAAVMELGGHLAPSAFVPSAVLETRSKITGSVDLSAQVGLGPVARMGDSGADVSALIESVASASWPNEIVRDNLLSKLSRSDNPLRDYDLFLQDLQLNSRVNVDANGSWRIQSKNETGSPYSVTSLPSSFDSFQHMADHEFLEAVEAVYRRNTGGGFFVTGGNLLFSESDTEDLLQGYVPEARDTFPGDVSSYMSEFVVNDIDWDDQEVIGAEGTARRWSQGDFTAVRMESKLADYWDEDRRSSSHDRLVQSSKGQGSDASHIISRSFAPMFDRVMPTLLDVPHNIQRGGSDFNRHLQEEIEAPVRKEIEAYMRTVRGKDLDVSMTVATYNQNSAEFNSKAFWDKASVSPSIVSLVSKIQATDPSGAVVKSWTYEVEDPYVVRLYEQLGTK
jgi:hypothetical protein